VVRLDRAGPSRSGVARNPGQDGRSAVTDPARAGLSFRIGGPNRSQCSGRPDRRGASFEALRHPAYGLDRLWNACCWNKSAANLFRGWLDGNHQRNLLRFVFTNEAARSLIPQWQERARRLLAEFRADFGHTFRDPRVKAFIDELKAESTLFAGFWDRQDVQYRTGGVRTFDHPRRGRLCFDQHSFSPTERQDFKLVLLKPRASQQRSKSRSAR
jgi:hypothetical protein